MLGSTRLSGETACMVIDDYTDSLVFREYVRTILGPTLRPDDIGSLLPVDEPPKNKGMRFPVASCSGPERGEVVWGTEKRQNQRT